ncbi:hypothetical protein [Natrialba asiatica]|uniref:Uncharacterized protein n=1 Tax=Natrialba asiatica (strain ATCC 700177 / DSM 12278 / JCM 9576 / FERM P-10747 / NBRC 102637 / 172P1) TaxID=29540 RepID=M0ALG6_NATA1|nr:hypothetical protein [Natrialba asiatica]ELY99535.1 hypothetical protein C481_14918 [Natrialba asiatica DSM 12278]
MTDDPSSPDPTSTDSVPDTAASQTPPNTARDSTELGAPDRGDSRTADETVHDDADSTADTPADDSTPPSERSHAESDRSSDEGSSLGLSLAVYVVRLTVAGLLVGGRLLWVGARIGIRLFTETKSRRDSHRWLLLEGDRRVIAGGFVGGIFVIALLLGVSDVIGVRESRFVTTMFSTMIAGLFSFIPIVVAVNQLIISRLFGTPDRLTDRIDGVQEFRTRIEQQTEGDGVSPTNPAPFLARLAGTLGSRADALVSECESDDGTATDDQTAGCSMDAFESIRRFASQTRDHTSELSSTLTGGTDSVFDVVLPTIDHDYAGAATEARRFRRRFDDELSDRASELLSELRELFVAADATRQYFTTIYLQRDLARLSRWITYSGTAALLLSTLVIMIYASGYPPVAHEGPLLVLVSLALAVAFSPLGVLFAYVVRISAVLKRTSAPGAFTPSSPPSRPSEAGIETADSEPAATAPDQRLNNGPSSTRVHEQEREDETDGDGA